MRHRLWTIQLGALLCVFTSEPASVSAQQGDAQATTVTMAAGERYRAGAMRRWILGRHYRDLWTTPVEVEVLDLTTFAGGLEPLRTGGGRQTRSLRFLGADGREYSFRSVDKDPTPVLDSILRETVVDDLVQDGISAAHPYGALVAAPLLEAAGVLHVDPRLRVMPDDPALLEFREEFAGMLGLIEERPDENEGERAAFRGTVRVIASDRLIERLNEGPADTVDPHAFLRARIMDLFLGDWDRHRGQWRWATYDEGNERSWLPIPTDRDQAFSKFDGLAPRLVSLYMPQFVRFEEGFPSIERLHWNARALDRLFLAGLERPAWDSIGSALMRAMDDDVIEAAARRLPSEIYEVNSDELTTTLRARRDQLPSAWQSFYQVLAEKVDIQLTDTPEVVTVDRSTAGHVRVTAVAPSHSGDSFFDRRFSDEETREVRIHLEGGDDRVVFVGAGNDGIEVRVVGGAGNDSFDFRPGAGSVRLYDSEGQNTVIGDAPRSINTKDFEEWVWTEEDRDQPRDWGRRALPIFWSSYSSDLGLFIGGGARLEGYGFRKDPYASAFDIRGGFALFQQKGRLEIDGRINRENSRVFWRLGARVSGLDVLHYYGLGNESAAGAESFHRVDQTTAEFGLGLGVSTGPGFTLTGGLALERLSTDDNVGRFFETLGSPYGSGAFVQVGASARLELDPLAESETTANRVRLVVHASAFPAALDVDRTFGRGGAEGSALLSSGSGRISLAFRAGAEQVWGRFPWSEAAFIGGTESVRGWAEQRFAGDAAIFGSAELRLRVARPRVVVPVGVGVFGFSDAGACSFGWLVPWGLAHELRRGTVLPARPAAVHRSNGLRGQRRRDPSLRDPRSSVLISLRRFSKLFAGLAVLATGGCHAAQVRYQPISELPAELERPEATLFLLGDGGEASSGRDDVLAHLGERVAELSREGAESPVIAVFLGDNIYDVGARTDFEEEDLAKLTAQVQPLGLSPAVSAFFLPGNHDWAKGAGIAEGRGAIQVQQDWLERISGGRDVRLMPGDACPGPDTVDVGESIHLVFIDTEWLLRRPEDDCGDQAAFYQRLRADLEANRGKRVIVLSHHPLISGGPHGGNVSLFEHGPFVYYLAVKTGTSIQDIASGAYAAMIDGLRSAFADSGNPPLIHAAGHDHSLQVIRTDAPGFPEYQLVSGSASKTSNAARIDGTRYATNGFGYMQLDFHPDGIRLVVYAREVTGGPVRPVYTCSISGRGTSECPEAPLLDAPR